MRAILPHWSDNSRQPRRVADRSSPTSPANPGNSDRRRRTGRSSRGATRGPERTVSAGSTRPDGRWRVRWAWWGGAGSRTSCHRGTAGGGPRGRRDRSQNQRSCRPDAAGHGSGGVCSVGALSFTRVSDYLSNAFKSDMLPPIKAAGRHLLVTNWERSHRAIDTDSGVAFAVGALPPRVAPAT